MIRLIKPYFILLMMGSITVSAQSLKVGMPAPELKVESWVKGKPVVKLDTGRIYVIEFWATWCGPCRATIPELTRMQEKYKDEVTIIGVSVLEKNPDYVSVFVESMGNEMNYSVAKDDLSRKGATEGYMAKYWLAAGGAPGIPWAFIVDRTGKIAYIGGSGELEAALEKVIKGK